MQKKKMSGAPMPYCMVLLGIVQASMPSDATFITCKHCNVKLLNNLALQGCTRQAAPKRQDLSCTYLAPHELESLKLSELRLFM